MSRWIASVAVALAGAIGVHAQDTSSTVTQDTRSTVKSEGDNSKTVKYSGCIQTGSDTRNYVLAQAVPLDSQTSAAAGTSESTAVGTSGSTASGTSGRTEAGTSGRTEAGTSGSTAADSTAPGTSGSTTVGTSGSTASRDTANTIALMPAGKVEFQQHVGHKVEVTGVMVPAADSRTDASTNSGRADSGERADSSERADSPDTKTDTTTTAGDAMPQFRVVSIRQLAESC